MQFSGEGPYRTGLEASLRKERVDLVWFPSPSQIISEVRDIPFVMTVWDLAHRELQIFPEFSEGDTWYRRERLYQSNVGRAFHVVTESRGTGESLEKIYGLGRKNWTSIGLPLGDAVPPDPEIYKQVLYPYFYYPANYWAHKNHITILDALQKLDHKRVGIVMSGSDKGNRAVLDEYARRNDVGHRVLLLDRITDAQVQALILESVAVLMPSLLGPTNYPPLEALRFGVPAIVSDVHKYDHEPRAGLVKVTGLDSGAWAVAMAKTLSPDQPDRAPLFEAPPIDNELGRILQSFAGSRRLFR